MTETQKQLLRDVLDAALAEPIAGERSLAGIFYDRLFTTGIGAIQDLARQLEAVQDENAALRRELAAKEESMEARLIALEARLPKDSAPAPVSLKTVSTSK